MRIFGWELRRSQLPTPTERTDSSTSEPTPLRSYLDYYLSREKPHYAVLVTGEWGTGKTYQVRRSIGEDKAYYVSLFGLNKSDDVIAAVYTAMFPGKSWLKNLSKNIANTSAAIPGIGSIAVSGLASGLVGAFLRQEAKRDKPLIFDDLERCGLSSKEILGIINLYVEQHECRVIVIAHDDKLADEFGDAKEKIFGQTIQIVPDTDAAFSRFIEELPLSTEIAAYILSQKQNIIDVMNASRVKSLRILRHVIEDVCRLYANLKPNHLNHSPALSDLTRLFSAFSFEWRAGNLTSDDLINRAHRIMLGEIRADIDPTELPNILRVHHRYESLDLGSTLLSDFALKQMLVEGHFEPSTLRECIDNSVYFLRSEESTPWRIVISFDKLDDAEVSRGIQEMQRQFEQREVTDSEDMLHIFSLRMLLASRGELDKTVADVTAECISYIDDLLQSGRLPPRPTDRLWLEDIAGSGGGVIYWTTDTYRPNFETVFQHLVGARCKSLEVQYPVLTAELLSVMKEDAQKFFELVCHTRSGNNTWVSIPILAAIPPKDFVAAWMGAPKPNWYWIWNALQERYQHSRPGGPLQPENAWIQEVIALLRKEASNATGLARFRIERAIPNVPPLNEADT